MNDTSPALVAQHAVRRLPRLALLGLCLAYVLAGFLGRTPWKNADITAFGYMQALAQGQTPWWNPTLAGMPPQTDGLLPYWLGAWAIVALPALPADFAARLPFIAQLLLTLVATWYGVYYLARGPRAQPVAFAFGGEAQPTDYARAIADGGLLALLACLGLAQLSHEVTSYLTQLCCTALLFYALAASPYRTLAPALGALGGLFGLALSGAPSVAALLAGGSAVLLLNHPVHDGENPRRLRLAALVAAGLAGIGLLGSLALDLLHWRLAWPGSWPDVRALGKLLIWFAWPAWPLALWGLWRWRHQLQARRWPLHLALPLWFIGVSLAATVSTQPADRALLLGLPALATLAALALPTLSRSVAALIDWFTLIFFTAAALVIWVVWVAMQTGVPRQPAANVARLAPGFEPEFSVWLFLLALAASLVWGALVQWRAGRHQAAIWKSLVLPASGATLGWVLLMTLWLPLLDYARSYATMVASARLVMGPEARCVEAYGLSRAQVAAFQVHGDLQVLPSGTAPRCDWLLVPTELARGWRSQADATRWQLEASVWRPLDRNESLLLYQRRAP